MHSARRRSPKANWKLLCRWGEVLWGQLRILSGKKEKSLGYLNFFIFFKLRKEEQTEKKETAAAAAVRSNLLDYDRNTDPGEIELKKREYMKQNKGSFDDLMRAARMGHSKVRTLTWSSERKMRMVLRTSRQYRKMRTCIRPRRLRTTSNPESCMWHRRGRPRASCRKV